MKKLRGFIIMLIISLSLFGLTACQDGGNNATYEQITAKEVKEVMDTETDYIIIDARTEEEFAEGHIENAILIPEYEIAGRAEKELALLGYTNVKEFGGIIDWPYETVR